MKKTIQKLIEDIPNPKDKELAKNLLSNNEFSNLRDLVYSARIRFLKKKKEKTEEDECIISSLTKLMLLLDFSIEEDE